MASHYDNEGKKLHEHAQSLSFLFFSWCLKQAQLLIGSRNLDGEYSRTAVDELRKQLADVYVDNAKLRKQMNSVIRYALQTVSKSEDNEEESPSTKTALTKF